MNPLVAHEINVFKQNIRRITRRGKSPHNQRVAIALSGGVDSVALSWLWHKAFSHDPKYPRERLNAFVVDHKLRPTSSQEARITAQRFEELTGGKAWILGLDWEAEGGVPPPSRVETVARRLRYQAIGRACLEQDIKFVLTGHHADDQAETVLSRLLAGARYTGLSAMAAMAALPECEAIYGVNDIIPKASGDSMQKPICRTASRQGVHILRPLLSYRKDDLYRICTDQGLEWIEDETNQMTTLTQRNAIRHILRSDLPKAIQVPQLLRLAETAGETERTEYEQLRRLHSQPRLGKVFIPHKSILSLKLPTSTATTSRSTFTSFVRSIVNAISRHAPKSRSDCLALADHIFHAEMSIARRPGTVAEQQELKRLLSQAPVIGDVRAVAKFSKRRMIAGAAQPRWNFISLRPPRMQIDKARIALRYFETKEGSGYFANPDYPAPTLWDGRFWIKARVDPDRNRDQDEQESFVLRTLADDELKQLSSPPTNTSPRNLDTSRFDTYQTYFKRYMQDLGACLPTLPLLAKVCAAKCTKGNRLIPNRHDDLSDIIAVPSWSYVEPEWEERLSIEVAHRSLGQNAIEASQVQTNLKYAIEGRENARYPLE